MMYFLVYNDDTHNYYIDNLLKSVELYGKEFQIIVFHKKDINEDFNEKYKSILCNTRGGGYWLWKPYIIYETLKKLNENDIIFYMDSKYYFLEDFSNLYYEFMKYNDILVWKNKPSEPVFYMKNWCKMDTIKKYDMFDNIFNKNVEDCWAGAIVVKKNKNSILYIKEWLDICCNYEDITDSPSKLDNSKFFIEHRHDQSLLSIVIHKYNIKLQYLEEKYIYNIRVIK